MAGIVIVGAGIIWSVGFPKTRDVLRPDFVASVAIGIGLIVTGVLVFRLTRSRLALTAMGTVLMWSLLVNAYLAATTHSFTKLLDDQHRYAAEHRK
jgi:hypothetical protein